MNLTDHLISYVPSTYLCGHVSVTALNRKKYSFSRATIQNFQFSHLTKNFLDHFKDKGLN